MKRWLFVVSLMFGLMANSFADKAEEEIDLDKIVVTPTSTEENVSSTGSSVSVLSGKLLERRGIYSVKDALKEDSSIDIIQAGSYGGSASIFLRGANSGQTRMMIDGIRVYDPISPNAAFDPAFLSLDNVDRIEIVKGPQSSLYGSDAIGGVINVITKKGEGSPKISLFEEGGTYDTHREGSEINGAKDKLHFAFSNSHLRSEGLSKASKWYGNSERDSYENLSYALRLDYDFSNALSLGLINRFTYAKYSYDDSGGVGGDDPNRNGWTKQNISSVFLKHKVNDSFEHKLQLSWMGSFRRDLDESDSVDLNEYLRDWYNGQTQQADWQGNYKVSEFDTVVAGFNFLRERGESYYYSVDPVFGTSESVFPKRYAWTKGYFIENKVNFEDKFTSTLAYRLEDHSRFNIHNTFKVDSMYKVDRINTKIKSSFGTGFKAPTLYQLYVPSDPFFGGGNTNLSPEKSYSYEAGLEQPFFAEKMDVGLTFFHNNYKNLIDAVYNPNTFIVEQYKNVSKSRSFGYESQLKLYLFKDFKITGNYTWLDTENKETHLELIRRAKNKADLNFDYKLSTKMDFNLDLRYVGSRFDSGNIKLKRYFLVGFATYYDITDNFRLYARVENLLDRRYEEIKGYSTPGASLYAGIKAKF